MKPEQLQDALARRFQTGIEPIETPFEIPQYRVAPDAIIPVLEFLRDSGFDMLLDVGGVDYLPRSPRFEVVYHLLDMKTKARVCLRCSPPDEDAALPSAAHLWPSAAPAEREVYDLFGVRFNGHPHLVRIMMPDDWEGHPLRKDYPVKGPREAIEARYLAEKNRYHAPKLAP